MIYLIMVIEMDCLFCKIIKGNFASKTIYEYEFVKAILDVNPTSNGHTLILPKKHFNDFEEIDDETLIQINKAAKEVKKILYQKLNPDGMVLLVNYGLTQAIKHYHMHLIPVYKDHRNLDSIDNIYQTIKKD